MLFKEFGGKSLPTVFLLHGGLSWWSLIGIIELLEKKYHIVTPIIDGHGEAGGEISLLHSAEYAELISGFLKDEYDA